MLIYQPPSLARGSRTSLPNGSLRKQAQRLRRNVISWRRTIASEAAQQVLRNTLRSACDVIGADRGFILQGRDDGSLEVACACRIGPQELINAALGRAAPALHQAMSRATLGLVDRHGSLVEGFQPQCNAPVAVALPLDLGPGLHGTLCLLREDEPRPLSALDAEILGALADQAALALRAASQESALSKLAASLQEFAGKHSV